MRFALVAVGLLEAYICWRLYRWQRTLERLHQLLVDRGHLVLWEHELRQG